VPLSDVRVLCVAAETCAPAAGSPIPSPLLPSLFVCVLLPCFFIFFSTRVRVRLLVQPENSARKKLQKPQKQKSVKLHQQLFIL